MRSGERLQDEIRVFFSCIHGQRLVLGFSGWAHWLGFWEPDAKIQRAERRVRGRHVFPSPLPSAILLHCADADKERICKRFWMALVLTDIIAEVGGGSPRLALPGRAGQPRLVHSRSCVYADVAAFGVWPVDDSLIPYRKPNTLLQVDIASVMRKFAVGRGEIQNLQVRRQLSSPVLPALPRSVWPPTMLHRQGACKPWVPAACPPGASMNCVPRPCLSPGRTRRRALPPWWRPFVSGWAGMTWRRSSSSSR